MDTHSFIVGGERTEVSDTFWRELRGPKPLEGFECDGCSHSPDVYRTVTGRAFKLWPACVIHDFHYRDAELRSMLWVPGTAGGRRYADDALYWNIKTLVQMQGGSAFTAHRIAWLYWGRVRIWGASSFQHWDEGEKPLSRWARIREVW